MTLMEAVYSMFAVLGGGFTLLILTLITRADKLAENWRVSIRRTTWTFVSLAVGLIYAILVMTEAEFIHTLMPAPIAGRTVLQVFTMIMSTFAFCLFRLIVASMFEQIEPPRSEHVRERLRELHKRRHK